MSILNTLVTALFPDRSAPGLDEDMDVEVQEDQAADTALNDSLMQSLDNDELEAAAAPVIIIEEEPELQEALDKEPGLFEQFMTEGINAWELGNLSSPDTPEEKEPQLDIMML